MGLDLVSFLERTNKQFGITRSPIKKIKEEEEKETILDTFPEPFFDDHEEELLKERDKVRDEKIMIIERRNEDGRTRIDCLWGSAINPKRS